MRHAIVIRKLGDHGELKKSTSSLMGRHLFSTSSGSHAIVIYRDLGVFQETYSEYCKAALSGNEIVVLISHYETSDEVKQTLSDAGVNDVAQHLNEGTLIILESAKSYLIDPHGTFKLAKSLVQRTEKENKKGVSVLADLGAFFSKNMLKELVEYESTLPTKYEGNLRGFCFYLQSDIDKLSSSQRKMLTGYHDESRQAGN